MRGKMGFETVTIVGVGLIGGSIGLGLKARGLAKRVIGAGYRRSTLSHAAELGAIDEATLDLADAARRSDLVIVATPVGLIVEKVRLAAANAGERCLVTDVGSTKRAIARALRGVRNFVPGHPIAGSEQRGNLAAREDLFEGALCVLTPPRACNAKAVAAVRSMWRRLGMKVVEMTPARHDALLASTSHLPHAVAAALVAATGREKARFAGSGFRDTTRIAGGDARVWRDILLANADKVGDSLRAFMKKCGELEAILDRRDGRRLEAFLSRAKEIRDETTND